MPDDSVVQNKNEMSPSIAGGDVKYEFPTFKKKSRPWMPRFMIWQEEEKKW